jgi:hypothetical protein
MPHKISITKETGRIVIGSAIAGTVSVGADEATHCCRKNKEISRTTRSTTTYYCHPGQSNGSFAEATTCAR